MARTRSERRIGGAGRPRAVVALQLVALYAATVAVLTLLSPGGAVIGGAVLAKVLFLLRMVVLLALATAFLWMRRLGWREVGLRSPQVGRFLIALPLGLIASLAAAAMVRASQGALSPHAGAAKDYAMFQPVAHRLPEYLYWLFAAWTTAAFGEEMLFRGFFLDALQRLFGGRGWATLAAVLAQAALFGVLHLYQGVNGAEVATAIGVVLGFVWWASGRNLWAGIIIHGVMDTAAMTVIFLGLLPH